MFEKFKNKVERGISIAKITFLIGVLSTFLNNAEAQNNDTEKVDLKHQIELAKGAISKIKVELDEKCKGVIQTSNGQNVNSHQFPNGQFVKMADNGDYLIVFNEDGTKGFFDANSDGKLDRMIINGGEDKDVMMSQLKMLGDIKDISDMARVTSMIKPQEFKVVEFRPEKGEIYVADFLDGSHGVDSSEKASFIIEKFQTIYTSQLENIVNNGNSPK